MLQVVLFEMKKAVLSCVGFVLNQKTGGRHRAAGPKTCHNDVAAAPLPLASRGTQGGSRRGGGALFHGCKKE